MEGIVEASRRYERWLASRCSIVPADLQSKHLEMARDPFRFMRATFYRWCQHWTRLGGEACGATAVLAVGDLHVENFGTWRDLDGRLIWGINDFDEAVQLPWTNDLARLAASVALANDLEALSLDIRTACEAILDGYAAGLEGGGRPFVLEEEHETLRRAAMGRLRDPLAFWRRMERLLPARAPDPGALGLILAGMPERGLDVRVFRRTAGLGSRGRTRLVGVADWRGGRVAREAKALVPSAWHWARGRDTAPVRYAAILRRAIRVPDPTVVANERWVLRRLAPHCTRIELVDLPEARDEGRLMYSMGFDTANVHLGTPSARARLLREARALSPRALRRLARAFVSVIEDDWAAFRRAYRPR